MTMAPLSAGNYPEQNVTKLLWNYITVLPYNSVPQPKSKTAHEECAVIF